MYGEGSARTVTAWLMLCGAGVGASVLLEASPDRQTPTLACESSSAGAFCRHSQRLYAASVNNDVVGIDMRSRELVWRVPTEAGLYSHIVATTSVVAFAQGYTEIWGLSPATGKRLWMFAERSRDLVAVGDYIVAQTAERHGAVALDGLTGKVVWRIGGARGSQPSFLRFFDVGGHTILANRFSLDAVTGARLVQWPAWPDVMAGALLDDLHVIGRPNGRITAYRSDSAVAWDTELPVTRWSNPRIDVLLADPDGLVVLAANLLGGPAMLFRVSRSGSIVWTHALTRDAGLGVGPVGRTNDLAILVAPAGGTRRTRITAFDLRTGAPRWDLSTDVRPTIGGGKLLCEGNECLFGGYDGNDEFLFAIDVAVGSLSQVFRFPRGIVALR